MRNLAFSCVFLAMGLLGTVCSQATETDNEKMQSNVQGKRGTSPASAVQEEKTDYSYKAAFQRAQKANRPLVVIVTATWCAPCQIMKNQTIKQVMAKDGFEDVILAFVDVDQEPNLAKNLTKGQGIPHVVVFEKKESKWKRRTLFGVQTAETLQTFIKPQYKSLSSESESLTRIAEGPSDATTINR